MSCKHRDHGKDGAEQKVFREAREQAELAEAKERAASVTESVVAQGAV